MTAPTNADELHAHPWPKPRGMLCAACDNRFVKPYTANPGVVLAAPMPESCGRVASYGGIFSEKEVRDAPHNTAIAGYANAPGVYSEATVAAIIKERDALRDVLNILHNHMDDPEVWALVDAILARCKGDESGSEP